MGKLQKSNPLDPKLMMAWNQGFSAGVKEQRESDINSLVNLLNGLETISGIGGKRAWDIREFFLSKFGKEG
jgi:hypothetical protein